MSKLYLSRTNVDYNITRKELISTHGYDDYILFESTAFNKIVINDKEFDIAYQTGQIYKNGNYSAPSNEFTLYEEGSSELIKLVNDMFESDFEKTDIKDWVITANELCEDIKTDGDLWDLYVFVNDNACYVPNLEADENDEDILEELRKSANN